MNPPSARATLSALPPLVQRAVNGSFHKQLLLGVISYSSVRDPCTGPAVPRYASTIMYYEQIYYAEEKGAVEAAQGLYSYTYAGVSIIPAIAILRRITKQ